MKRINEIGLILLMLFVIMTYKQSANAQHHPHYSQYMLNGLAINPGYTGSHEVFSLAAMYRNQWVKMPGSPSTQTFCAHAPLRRKSMAVGLLVYNDKIGVTRNTSFLASYAYRFKVGNGKLSLGLSAGIKMIQSKWQEVETTVTNDQAFETNSPVGFVPEIGFGVYYYTKKYFVGFSIPELFSHTQELNATKFNTYHDFYNYNYMLNAGISIPVKEKFKVSPSFLLKYNSPGPVQLDINLVSSYKDMFYLGLSYRTGDAIVFMLEYHINNQFRIGYAYDYTLTDLRKYNNGSHEIMLGYKFAYKVNASNPRSF